MSCLIGIFLGRINCLIWTRGLFGRVLQSATRFVNVIRHSRKLLGLFFSLGFKKGVEGFDF